MRRIEKLGLRAAVLLLAAASPAFPIVLQYDQILNTGVGGFPSVVRVGGCSGVLLADGMHVLTAAHCASTYSSPDSINTTFNLLSGLTVGIFSASPASIPVAAIHLNPLAALMFPSDAASQLLIYDLAVLDLSSPAPADAGGYQIDASGNAIASNGAVTLAGWGLGGYPGGAVGSGGTLRAASNTVAGEFAGASDPAATPSNISLPDLPIELDWTTSSNIHDPNDRTGLGDHGDSGGPLIYNGKVIGVLAFGDLPDSGGAVLVDHTYVNGYTNLAAPGNVSFLTSLGLLEEVPEPATWAMMGAGALLLLWRRRPSPLG